MSVRGRRDDDYEPDIVEQVDAMLAEFDRQTCEGCGEWGHRERHCPYGGAS